MLALDIKNLNKKYKNFQLKDVSFELEKGYIMGFIGNNGAGKTTTIKSILNMTHIDSGEIEVLGKKFLEHEIELKQKVGYTLGGTDYYTRSKVKTLTNVIKKFYTNWEEETYKFYLTKFEIDENKRVFELSAGMKVKYNLSLALSHGAQLLILDEPTSGLDPAARDNLLEVFQELVEEGEISILFSTHITTDLEKCADYITFINDGQIINSTEKEDFINSYRLLHGDKSQLDEVKNKLISYKVTSFGYTGLIHSKDMDSTINAKATLPNLEEIMVYYSKKGEKNV